MRPPLGEIVGLCLLRAGNNRRRTGGVVVKPLTKLAKRFPKGQRVRSKSCALTVAKFGVVIGYGDALKSDGRHWTGIRILREHYRSPETYHPDFWEPMK